MELKTMIVTDKDGSAENAKGEICLKDNDPFSFYALDSALVREVRMVMPMGGNDTGFFRQPQVGEKVLVGKADDSEYYLLGFVPVSQKCFNTVYKTVKTDKNGNPVRGADGNMDVSDTDINKYKGQVLRYRNNGDNYTNHPYSEIGFYSKERIIANQDGINESIIEDEIDFISTGDIKNSASDNYSIMADTLHIGIGGEKRSNASIIIDDDGGIIIKSLDSIKLTVGRTSLSISDDGFSVTAKIADTPIENTYDASMSLKPLTGFSASGMKCHLSGIRDASISDSRGGKLSTSLGIVSIIGRELMLKTYNNVEHAFFKIFNTTDFVFNTIALGDGISYRDSIRKSTGTEKTKRWGDRANYIIKIAKWLLGFAKDVADIIVDFRKLREIKTKTKNIQHTQYVLRKVLANLRVPMPPPMPAADWQPSQRWTDFEWPEEEVPPQQDDSRHDFDWEELR